MQSRKKSLTILSAFILHFATAQNVVLTEVKEMSDNTDKFLYNIQDSYTSGKYLGTLEVQGYSPNDVEVFGKVYAKAKEIGANAYTFAPFVAVDEKPVDFDPSHYRLHLFYLDKDQFPKEDNVVYIFNINAKSQKIAFNLQNIDLPERTYIKRSLSPNQLYTISTRKLLGSSIKLQAKENQPVQYFQIESARIKANPYGTSGINLKSGDLSGLEKSYAQFLKTIYKETK